jgi:hypothetical protein
MRSGTELRQLYADSDEKGRQGIVADLFGRYTREAEQIMNSKIPAQKAITGLEPVAETVSHFVPSAPRANIDHGYYKLLAHRYKQDPRLLSAKEKQELHDFINSLKIVKECGGTGVVASKKQAKDPRYSTSLTKDVRPGQIGKNLKAFSLAEGGVDALAAQHVEYISQDIAAIKQRIATEKLPASYVEALKKKIAQLEQERVRITLGR